MLAAFLFFLFALPASGAPPRLDDAMLVRLHARLSAGEPAKRLEDELPRLGRNLNIAREISSRYWTDCTIVDELAKAEILSARTMKALGIRLKSTGSVSHASAGLMHTYGYLFSRLPTAYGYKSKRWVESRLDERLGLPAGTFSPLATEGEFASNLTSVLFQLIGAPVKIARAAPLTPAAKALGHVEQRVTWKTGRGTKVEASVFTHLVPLAPLPGHKTSDTHLLVYAVRRDGHHRLTTAFPVARAFAETIQRTQPDAEPVFSPRFNLYIDPGWSVTAQENSGWRAAEHSP